MFKAKLNTPKILKTSFEAISSIVDEIQIQTDKEGIRVNAIDRSHVSYVKLELKHELFEEFVCDEPEKINIDTMELMKVLKRSKSDDKVLMSLDEGNFIITFEGEATRTFKIKLIDLEYEQNNPPEINHPTTLEIPYKLLKDSVKDLASFSNSISLMIDNDNFKLSAKGDFGEGTIDFLHGEKVDTNAKSSFSAEKLNEIIKADKFSDIAIIGLGDDMPLSLKLEMVSEDGVLSFLLSPRVES